MVKRVLWLLVFISVATFAYASDADLTGSWYLKFETGLSNATGPDIKLENIVSADLGKTGDLGIGGGYQLYPKLRADFMITYRGGLRQEIDFADQLHARADFSSVAAMFSAYYEFSEWHGTIPYLMGGLGYVHNHLDTVSITDQQAAPVASIQGGGWSNLGTQFGGGFAFKVREDWYLDAGYRYLHYGKYESDDVIRYATQTNQVFERHVGKFSANDFTIALRIRFY